MKNEAKKILLLVVTLIFANSYWAQGADGEPHQLTSLRESPLLREALEIIDQAGWISLSRGFTFKIGKGSHKKYFFDLTAELIPHITEFDNLPWILEHPNISDSEKDALVVRGLELNQVIADKWLHLAWQEETKSALIWKSSSCCLLRIFGSGAIESKNTEPAYLEKISKLLAPRLEKIIKEKEAECLAAGGDGKVALTRHAYSLLFSMTGYWGDAYDAAKSGAGPAAWTMSAYDAARSAALHAAFDATRSVARSVARPAACYNAWNASKSAAYDAARGAFKYALNTGANQKQAAQLAYRLAEKVVLLYFLVNFEWIFHEFYNAGYKKLTSLPANNIFESRESWEAFKEEHFGSLREDALHYFGSLLDQLDGVAKRIAEL